MTDLWNDRNITRWKLVEVTDSAGNLRPVHPPHPPTPRPPRAYYGPQSAFMGVIKPLLESVPLTPTSSSAKSTKYSKLHSNSSRFQH